MTSERSTEYADVTDMLKRLSALEHGSVAYRRQRDEIVGRSLPLADHIAHRFKNRGEPLEDLIQVARVGLMQAVNRFDVDNGSSFVSFAVPTIMGEVRRHFRDHGWSLKVPRRLKDLHTQLNRARTDLTQQLGRAPTATELANQLGIDREQVVQAVVAGCGYSTLSSDVTAGPGDDFKPLGETFGDLDANLDKVLDVETLRPLLAALTERERTILALRFFENMTQSQIAERIGCSQMHVSRLLTCALSTLRDRARRPELV